MRPPPSDAPPSSGGSRARANPRLIAALLAVVTALLYWPIVHYPFIAIDDHEYIYDNSPVKSGLSLSGVAWAFTTGHASNWHPLTWLSHMLDCQLFGLNPGGHHFTNLLLHAANSVLLFFLLRKMTGAVWRNAFVAALFAWHPLHVESVAWASERKDVLCAFFGLLATMAYVRFADESKVQSPRSKVWFRAALVLFALGLMSKPMLVTLPFVWLLLDYWPLQRFPLHDSPFAVSPIVREKIPFFTLAFASSVVTYLVQSSQGATSSLQAVSLLLRAENVAISYARYLFKTFWPANLAAIYPYPKAWPVLWVAGALLLLAAVSLTAIGAARRQPFVLMGWLWFLGMLVPTIGLVQVGSQSMADRYMYLPAIGLFIGLAWGLHDLVAQRFPRLLGVLGAAGVAALVACLALTRTQLAAWRSSEVLFRHAIEVTRDNYIALDGLGSALHEAGRYDEAFKLFQESIRLQPRYAEAQYDLGTELLRRGELDEAAGRFRKALAENPKFAQAHSNLGATLLKQGKLDEAVKQFAAVIALQPDRAEAYFDLATVQMTQGRLAEAATNYIAALRLKPDLAKAHSNLGVLLMRTGRAEEGTRELAEAARLDAKNPEAHFNLGHALLDQGRSAEAQSEFARALEFSPGEPKYLDRLGLALARQKKFTEAIAQFSAALKQQPDNPEVLKDLAWIRCTSSEASSRDGAEAIRLAERADELTNHEKPAMRLALAAAYAEAGRFPEAVKTAESAAKLAAESGQKPLAERAEQLLKLFQSGQPARD